MSTRCSQGQVASRGGLGGAERRRAVGRRRRLALGLPGVARSGLARSGEKGSTWRGSAERAKAVWASVSARPRGCNTRALGASSARTPGVRHNAEACYRSQVRMGFTRSRLGATGSLVDKLVWSGDQVHSANQKFMPKQIMPIRCLTKCQGHLGISWSG